MWKKVTESLVLNKHSSCLPHKAVAQINELILKRQLLFPCNNSAIKVQSFLMNFAAIVSIIVFTGTRGLR